jgi:hypothetical protein
MTESKGDKSTPSFADAAIRAKEEKAARKAKAKKDQAAAGSKHAPKKLVNQPARVNTKANMPRMMSRAKKG